MISDVLDIAKETSLSSSSGVVIMSPTELIYVAVIGLIRTVKWVERQFLGLFSPWIIPAIIKRGENIGVIFHFTDESYSDWSTVDEEKALTKCVGKYDSLAHIRVHDKGAFLDIANQGGWGLGEGYVNQKWSHCKDEDDVVQLFRRFLEDGGLDLYYICWNRFWGWLEFDVFNLQTRKRAEEVARKHYDLGNDIYEMMLCPNMQYTCGYWSDKSHNLKDAQLAKMELVAKKLKLKKGMRVLELGCGWGMLCKYLAKEHGVKCVGVNIAKEGIEYGRKACEGLPVKFLHQDYREPISGGPFDRVVCVGMLEHVGFQNYNNFFEVVNSHLKDDGIFLLHTIGHNHTSMPHSERWLCTYIFPGGCIPKPKEIAQSSEAHFVIEDWHNFGLDYAKTLKAWRENFIRNWPSLEDKYGEEFYRMWNYYLTMCEGQFWARKAQLWQIVFSKDGLKEGYQAPR